MIRFPNRYGWVQALFVAAYVTVVTANGAEVEAPARNHPARTLSPIAVRDFILQSVEGNGELQKFVDLESLQHELPSVFDLFFPEDWPGLVVSGGGGQPFAMLGGWRLVFGREEHGSNGQSGAFVLQCVILSRERHLKRSVSEYTDVVLEPMVRVNVGDPKDGIEALGLQSWRVTRYTLTDFGLYGKGRGLQCLAAGGSAKWEVGENQDALLFTVWFIGRVERMPQVAPDTISASSSARE